MYILYTRVMKISLLMPCVVDDDDDVVVFVQKNLKIKEYNIKYKSIKCYIKLYILINI